MLPPLAFFSDVSDTTRITVSADATGSQNGTTDRSTASTSDAAVGMGRIGLTVFPWKPLVDDDSPRSLQGFLQRTSTVGLEVGGQYERATYSPPGGGGTYVQDFVPASASARWFALPAVALLGAVGESYLHDSRDPGLRLASTREVWETWGSVGVDVRSGDASASLDWQGLGLDEHVVNRARTAPPFFGARFTLAGRLVLARRLDVTASAGLIPHGAEGRAGFGWYPTKNLSLSLAAQVEHGEIYYDATTIYDAVLGGPALSCWVARRVELRVSYSPEWVRAGAQTTWQEHVSIGVTGRFGSGARDPIGTTGSGPSQALSTP